MLCNAEPGRGGTRMQHSPHVLYCGSVRQTSRANLRHICVPAATMSDAHHVSMLEFLARMSDVVGSSHSPWWVMCIFTIMVSLLPKPRKPPKVKRKRSKWSVDLFRFCSCIVSSSWMWGRGILVGAALGKVKKKKLRLQSKPFVVVIGLLVG